MSEKDFLNPTETTEIFEETVEKVESLEAFEQTEQGKNKQEEVKTLERRTLSSFDKAGLRKKKLYPKKEKNQKNLSHLLLASLLSASLSATAAYFVSEHRFYEMMKKSRSLSLPVAYTQNIATNQTGNGELPFLRPQDIATVASPAVVAIHTQKEVQSFWGTHAQKGAGSGVLVHEEGYIVTNYHVIENGEEIYASTSDGKKYQATLVGVDEPTDLALLKIEKEDGVFPYLSFANSSDAKVGEQVVAIGNPLGEFEGSITVGYVSALNRSIETQDVYGQAKVMQGLIQTDAPINRGNSGGALINARGELLGINTIKTMALGVEGIGFAIPANTVQPIVEDLMQHGKVTSRPYFGITGQTITEAVAERYGLAQGVWIKSVVSGGSAAQAGLKEQDIIIEIEGEKIEKVEQIQALRLKYKVGDTLKIKYIRSGETRESSLVLSGETK